MRLIGIDPGAKGAIALFIDGAFELVQDIPTVDDKGRPRVDAAALATLVRGLCPDRAILERVASRPGQGVASMFQFGRAVGIVEGVLAALQIPVSYVTPVQWKGALHVPKDKGGARLRASQLIPAGAHCWLRSRDDGRAEASLIALFANQVEGNSIVW